MSFRVVLSRFVLVLVAAFALALTGCNTMSGMGRDISHAGQNMECCAEQNK